MPLRGAQHSCLVSDDAPFFRSLAELDEWATNPVPKLEGVLSFTPRSGGETENAINRGKLLGGYTESPTAPAYTFNFWSYCESFIYFSHHRVTIPPSGWVTAAHRHGVKMLGNLIFEHAESEADCLRLLVGALPTATTGPAKSNAHTLPVSPHYARVLADLAYQRGFDGYLLNVEAPLRGGVEQTRALTLWIAMLEQELKRKVGVHAEVVWYDSVIVDGRLAWQDRLNSINLPFFIPSTAFFSNYTWPSPLPAMTAQYLLSLDQMHFSRRKQLKDLYIGVDVWGRGSHGGGGLGVFRALEHISPETLGLSVALFGHAWTWESEQDKPGWSWKTWWDYECKLWLGPKEQEKDIPLPPMQLKRGEPPCDHGTFKPIADYFPRMPPPDPKDLPFFTTFSPGVGWSWFVRGRKVLHSETGWTDLSKTTSIGDMVFPRAMLAWENIEREEAVPAATSDLSMDDGWLGGSSLVVSVSAPGSEAEDAFFRCVWLPIQSLAITPRQSYRMSVIYKVDGSVDTDVGASVKGLLEHADLVFEVSSPSEASYEEGWTELLLDFTLPIDRSADITAAAGLVIGFACEDPTQAVDFSIHVGSLSVYANLPTPAHTPLSPKVIWVDFRAVPEPMDGAASPFAGTLTWGTGISLGPLPTLSLSSAEDPKPCWVLDHPPSAFAYFGVYALAHTGEGAAMPPEEAIFVGTTGLDGRANRFYVDPPCLPAELQSARKVRFFVQGVTDRGQVLEWEDCAFVDVTAVAGEK
ncbi:glycosyl hydrolase family 85-domain-containing protein [Daedaleopsis nitida]|nr:glycosyl hydrolase family 85-domain-containing protein [Daedaleopsis nitida]